MDPAGAVAAAGEPDAVYLAGGTNLVDLMKLGVVDPSVVVDVRRLPLAKVVENGSGSLVIGATVSNSDLAVHPLVRERYPVLSQALLSGASGQLRNMATVGGNLLQRTRCLYFMDVTKPCNKRSPGTGCPARDGNHRNLAILGASNACIATHPSDMAVALCALGAFVHLQGPAGERVLPVDSLYRFPGDRPDRDFDLSPAELIVSVEVPPLAMAACSIYRKARERASYAFALGSVAAALDIEGGMVRDVRLAFGAVAPRPWRAWRAEAALRGGPATAERFAAAADAEMESAVPLERNAYKLPLLRNLVVDVLGRLSGDSA